MLPQTLRERRRLLHPPLQARSHPCARWRNGQVRLYLSPSIPTSNLPPIERSKISDKSARSSSNALQKSSKTHWLGRSATRPLSLSVDFCLSRDRSRGGLIRLHRRSIRTRRPGCMWMSSAAGMSTRPRRQCMRRWWRRNGREGRGMCEMMWVAADGDIEDWKRVSLTI